jgi:hypothetical protein
MPVNECTHRIHPVYSFRAILLPHLPPLAAPNPLSGAYTRSANKRSSFTIITAFITFMFNALLLL